jgi:hypothetical protein
VRFAQRDAAAYSVALAVSAARIFDREEDKDGRPSL